MSAKKRRSESNAIEITRIYDAPVKAVWEAWTDPAQAAKWWGPRGFTITTHSKDLRPGGHWSYTMHGPDGVDYPNTTKYFEVEKHAKLVYDHGGSDDRPPLFRVTVTFSEARGKTTMQMRMTLPTVEAAAETRAFIKKAGGNSTWDRLAEYLAEESSGEQRFVINRSFDASVETVYAMWTEPRHFTQWLAPAGFHMEILEGDIRAGATVLYMMSDGAKVKMHGKIAYQSLERPDRLVYTQQFCDAQGRMSRHPLLPTWPETMQTTVELFAEAPDQTRVAVTWQPVGKTTEAERAAFAKERGGMTQGWTGSFDKLDAYLEAQAS